MTVYAAGRPVAECLPSGGEAHANARLIAAAPEMLAALRAVTARCERFERHFREDTRPSVGFMLSDDTDCARALLARVDGA